MAKFYFAKDGNDCCYTLAYHLAHMKEYELTEMEVIEAKIMYGEDYFWCSQFGEIGEVGESCGVICDSYKPRNGKNGRCRFNKNTYEQTDIIKVLTL